MADFVNAQELRDRILRRVDIQDDQAKQAVNEVINILDGLRKERQYTFRIYHEEEK